jgi:hypothetical protein
MKMKSSMVLTVLVLALLTLLIHSWADPSSGETRVASPTAKTTGIIASSDRFWTIDALNEIAASRLALSNKVTLSDIKQVTVSVYVQDSSNMCVFRYSAGFDSPTWTVKFGYDGKITSVEKRMRREGQ